MRRINGLVLALLCFKTSIASPNPQPGLQLEVEVKTVSPFVTSDEDGRGGGASAVPGRTGSSHAKGKEIGTNEEEGELGHDDCVDGFASWSTKMACTPGVKCNTCFCKSKDTRKPISFKCERGRLFPLT